MSEHEEDDPAADALNGSETGDTITTKLPKPELNAREIIRIQRESPAPAAAAHRAVTPLPLCH